MSTKFPIFVMEGPDCSGKTTLADVLMTKLKRRYGDAKYMHATYRFKSRIDLYHRAMIDRAIDEADRRPVILDRLWGSEVVYARAFRGGTPWPRNARTFDRICRTAGMTYVFCVPNNRDNYVNAWLDDRERRYSDKPWALNGRSKATDDQGMVWDLYQSLLEWMQYKERNDVFLYDRLGPQGRDVHGTANTLVETALTQRGTQTDRDWLVVQSQLVQPGRHDTYPGAQWTLAQRWFDAALDQYGVPDHVLHFTAVRSASGLPLMTKSSLSWYIDRYPYSMLLSEPGSEENDFSDVLSCANDWPSVIKKLRRSTEGLQSIINQYCNGRVRDAAYRLGLA